VIHLVKQYENSQNAQWLQTPCSGLFTDIYGLPCGHRLKQLIDDDPNSTITAPYIDPFWFFQRPAHSGEANPSPIYTRLQPVEEEQVEQVISPPVVVRTSGRPVNYRNLTTRRQLLFWEASVVGSVEPSTPLPPPRPDRAFRAPRGRIQGSRNSSSGGTSRLNKAQAILQLRDARARIVELERELEDSELLAQFAAESAAITAAEEAAEEDI